MAFSNYGGIIAPSSVASKDDVKRIQQQLGVQVDGLWGPKTQAAYEASQASAPSYSQAASFNYGTTDLDALQDQIYSKLSAPSISYEMPSQKELAAQISEYLRPGYDSAISQRKQQTLQNRAAIDADAASRGMGRSSYVTDVKDQAMDAEAADIASLESAYNAALLQSVMDQYNQHLSNKMAADQYNASAEAAARQAALGYSTSMYQNNLAKLEEELARSNRGRSAKSFLEEEEPNEFIPSKMNISTAISELNSITKALGANSAREALKDMMDQGLIDATEREIKEMQQRLRLG